MFRSRLAAPLGALLWPVLAMGQTPIENNDLDEVVVVGHSVITGLASVDVDHEMIVDTATVLKKIPGADVNANGPVTGIAQYRGMYGDRVSVVIDHLGVVSGGPNAMDAPLSYVSPMITSELSVTRGIPSVSLAPESIGGHVATRLARGEFSGDGRELSGFVGSRYSANGDLSTTAARMTFASPSQKLSLIAEIDNGDDVSTPVGEVLPSRLHRKRSDLSYSYSDGDTSVMLFVGKLDTEDTGTAALPMDIRFIDTTLAGAQAEIAASESVRLTARLAWNDVEHLMDNFGLRQAPMPMAQRQNFTTGTGGRFSGTAAFDLESSVLTVGVDASTAEHDATITNPNNALFRVDNFVDVTRDIASAFVELTMTREQDDVELGLRMKRVTANAGAIGASGMMGDMGMAVETLAGDFNSSQRSLDWNSLDVVAKFRRSVRPGTEWHIEIGSKTRAPSYQELYLWLPLQATGGLADGRSYIGGLGLDEERSNEITLGTGMELGRMTLTPQVFYRRVDGYIQGVPSDNTVANMVSQMMSGQPALEFANVDADIWGADLAWKLQLSEDWYLDGIASFVRGERRDIDDNLYRLAPPHASAGLTRATEALSATIEVVGYARQSRVSSYNNEQETSGYGLVNLAVAWKPSDALRLEAHLDNAFDRVYQHHVAGINRASGSEIPVGARLYGLERTVSVGAVFSF